MTLTVKVSETGSVELPESVREANGWEPGTELEVEELASGIFLKVKTRSRRAELYPPISIEEFLARRPAYDGPPISIEEMDAAVLREAKRRWDAEER